MLKVQDLHWFECNLPWSFHFSAAEKVKYPQEAIDLAIQENFPEWEKLEKQRADHVKFWRNYCSQYGIDNSIFPLYLIELAEEKMNFPTNDNAYQFCKAENKKYLELQSKVNQFYEKIPELNEYYKALGEQRQKEKERSFCGQGLNVPGTIIQFSDGSQELLGTINCIGGICNDCEFEWEEKIITRYARIISI